VCSITVSLQGKVIQIYRGRLPFPWQDQGMWRVWGRVWIGIDGKSFYKSVIKIKWLGLQDDDLA